MFKIRNKIAQLPQIGWFLARQSLSHTVDRISSHPSREQAVLDYVKINAPPNDPSAVLQAMDEFAVKQRWLMNVGPKKGQILLNTLRSADVTRMLEIGAYCGYSAVLAGQYLSGSNGYLVSIEKSKRCASVARQIVEHAGLSQCVEFCEGTLTDHIGSFNEPFDAVFLDHWKDEYLPDLQRIEAAGLLSPGSVVIADNIEFFDVPDYLQHVRDSGAYASTFHESSVEYNDRIPDGVEVSIYQAQTAPP